MNTPRALATLAVAIAFVAACQPVTTSSVPSSPIAADIDTLASRAFNGRQAGTPGADSAALFLARRYERLGLRAAFPVQCESAARCQTIYFQLFQTTIGTSHNVGAIVEGLDSARRSEYIVIGAHFDHLGHSPTFAMDRYAGFVLRPGADDNASGTAAVLELARRFADRAAKRSIVFVNFDAEEEGLIGSQAFLVAPPVPTASIALMLNLDMVGRLRGEELFVDSRRMERGMRLMVDSMAKTIGIRARFIPSDGRSDDETFLDDGIAAIGFSTGMHADYHRASDIPSRINVAGLTRVVDLVESVARRIADR